MTPEANKETWIYAWMEARKEATEMFCNINHATILWDDIRSFGTLLQWTNYWKACLQGTKKYCTIMSNTGQ